MPEVRLLEPEEIEELVGLATQAAAHLEIPIKSPPKDIVRAINALLRDIEDDAQERPADDMVMRVAVLLAFQYTRAFEWNWSYVTWDDEFSVHSITSPDASIAIAPIQWVNAISKKEATTNVLLNFNMVAAGGTPTAPPGACLIFQ